MINMEKSESRTKNSLKNIISNFVNNILLNVLRFISRIIFVKVLSDVYLGVNGLLSNILGILALSELGIGTAINFSLYKPLAKNNEKKINSLMSFYKKTYNIIAIIVLVLGLIILPFLPYFIKDSIEIDNLNLIYLIFLANMVIGYLFSYKRTLIIADQKNYKIMPFIIFYNFLTTVLQIVALLVFKNYIIYLLIQTACILLENITVNKYINKQYGYLKNMKEADKIDKEELSTIKKNVKALMFHKIGGYAVTSTDNLIISKFIGVVTVGIYSNYCLLLNTISSVIYVFVSNLTASFGNLIVNEDSKKRLKVFEEVNYVYYLMYAISFICFINLFNPFIEFAFGAKFVLSIDIVYLIVINYYFYGMVNVLEIVKSAAGLYDNDKYIAFIQALINIGVSILLAIKMGLVGVFIGTFVSTLLPLIVKPIIVYRNIFNENPWNYFKTSFKQIIYIFISLIISLVILNYINVENAILNISIRLVISVIVPVIVLLVCTCKTKEFQGTLSRIKFILNRRKTHE